MQLHCTLHTILYCTPLLFQMSSHSLLPLSIFLQLGRDDALLQEERVSISPVYYYKEYHYDQTLIVTNSLFL